MVFGLADLGSQAVAVALVAVTNLAPVAGLEGLVPYADAAACALAGSADTQESSCRSGARAAEAVRVVVAKSAAETGDDADGDDERAETTATARPAVVADGTQDCPRTSPTPGGQGRADATAGRAPAGTGRDDADDDDETGDSRKGGGERTEKDDRSSGDRGGNGDSTGNRGSAYDESDGSAPRQSVVHEGQDDEPGRGGDSDEDRDSGSRALRAVESQARVPGDLIELADWYLTLPTGKPGDPDTIENPQLATFTNDAFKLNDRRDGVVFSARADGVTTKNSHFPRSELREMTGSEKAAWSNTSGTHTLDVCEAVTKAPAGKPEVVAAQIHDGNDDVMQIRLEGKTLMVQYNDGKSEQVIDPDYTLGTPYNVRIVAAGGKVDVLYNGEQKAELPVRVGLVLESRRVRAEQPRTRLCARRDR